MWLPSKVAIFLYGNGLIQFIIRYSFGCSDAKRSYLLGLYAVADGNNGIHKFLRIQVGEQTYMASLFLLMGKSHLAVPDYTTLCRRQKNLPVEIQKRLESGENLEIAIEMKIYMDKGNNFFEFTIVLLKYYH
ncbi:hypothetical protein FACS189426_16140 [Bacteroidia bacterium]|nr:hypothetical protein FACS189426_16140 [Bacteroidia bacterium]